MSSRISIIFSILTLVTLAQGRWPAYRERMSELANLAENSDEINDEFKILEERNGRINPFNMDDDLFKSLMEKDNEKLPPIYEELENGEFRRVPYKAAETEETSAESSENLNELPASFQIPRGMVILPARIVEENENSEEEQSNEVRSPIMFEQVKGVILSYQPENNDDDDSTEIVYANEVKPIGVERIELDNTANNVDNSDEQETNENVDNLSYKIILPNDAENDQDEQVMDRPMNDQPIEDEDAVDDDDEVDINNRQMSDQGADDDDTNDRQMSDQGADDDDTNDRPMSDQEDNSDDGNYNNDNNEQANYRATENDDDDQQQSVDENVFATY